MASKPEVGGMTYPNKIITAETENRHIELGQLLLVHIGAPKINLAIVVSFRIGYWFNVLCDEGIKTIHRMDISSLNDKIMMTDNQ